MDSERERGKESLRFQSFWATAKAAACKVFGNGQLCKYENVTVVSSKLHDAVVR